MHYQQWCRSILDCSIQFAILEMQECTECPQDIKHSVPAPTNLAFLKYLYALEISTLVFSSILMFCKYSLHISSDWSLESF